MRKEEFAKRLKFIMINQGYISARSDEKVDAKPLATAAGCSLQMAYKYLKGKAIPNPRTLKKIAGWLNTDAWWLLYGEKTEQSKELNSSDLLQKIFLATRDKLQSNLDETSFQEKLKKIFSIYQIIKNLNSSPKAENIIIDTLLAEL